MSQYLFFIGALTAIYFGYLFVQARERKRMRRYYGYTTRRRSEREMRRAA